MKKALKIVGITILFIFFLLLALPFAFQSQIKDLVKNFINQNLNAHVEFRDVSLSFIKSFPQAHVTVDHLTITNFAPFEGDTLAAINDISFSMSVKELFKGPNEAVIVNSIAVDKASLTFKTNSQGITNYDIVKSKENEPSKENSPMALDIEDYSLKNSDLTYIDESSNLALLISELNHSGKAKYTSDRSELDTKSEAYVSLTMDRTQYLNYNSIKLDALIDMDFNTNTYTFKDNKAFINQLPLEFSGFLQLLDEGQKLDITFENPESSFKNFLAVIPEAYSKNLANVETSGDFKVKGKLRGMVTEEIIPALDISIISDNASFKYPDLPKRVENITINTTIKNTTGYVNDTYVDINTLNFKIDNDVFRSSATLKNITKNMLVNANIDGSLNLANISKAYPIQLNTPLSGVLKAKVNTAFDMNAIETSAYERIKNLGSASLTDFMYASKEMANPIQISKANITFNPESVSLHSLEAKIGQSDISASGTIRNLIGFLLNKNELQGNFNVSSNTFALNDFMIAKTENKTEKTEKEDFKIPQFLDCTINANANTVIYDNLNLKDVRGTLTIKDQQASIKGLTSSLFDGVLAVTGDVSTKTAEPSFNLNLGADGFDIVKSFDNLDILKALAPIAKALQGKLNTTLSLSGTLNQEFTPNLNSLSGNAFAELIGSSINSDQNNLLSSLTQSLNFVDFKKLDLKDLKAHLEFSEGKVNVKPFNLNYEDIGIVVSGSHGFDKTMAFEAVFNVPAKYLGNDVNQLLGKINDNEVNKISIPITANITGSYTSPKITTDLTSGVSNLTKQLVEIEKQKLLNQGKSKINTLLSGLTGIKNPTTTDSTFTQTKTTKTDSTATKPKNAVSEGVKNVLGGLLKNRKKKDSVN
jgi:hypothetical protein